ncbi:hypothetical protein GX48_04715 [Paracoccidioides brasiliensis]|nr:hypothetical protein GX48_04715 [Paracoccidioides brasiliensis]
MALRLFAIGSYAAGEEDLAPQLISLHGTRTGGHIRRVQELFFYISDVSSSVKPLNATCLETRGWHGWDTMEETWAAGIWLPDAPVFPTSSQSELRNNMWNVDSFIVGPGDPYMGLHCSLSSINYWLAIGPVCPRPIFPFVTATAGPFCSRCARVLRTCSGACLLKVIVRSTMDIAEPITPGKTSTAKARKAPS